MTLLCNIRQLLGRKVDKRCVRNGLFIVGIVENELF